MSDLMSGFGNGKKVYDTIEFLRIAIGLRLAPICVLIAVRM